ncbi:response regulator [Desulfobacula phenolica]|uniref:Chemotaxis phosphatase CheX n=1 Tax=Desulfobacula phenolica TaxID=90732 RepID=A0A1H2DNC6_9BACT|nr:response regulator [Desulfobacula phenolica]SDT84395.1 Chemotaxis phosphatase CheX [Desulfobacula phenolica]
MTQFTNHLNILSDSCKETIEQMTRLKIKNINIEKTEQQTKELPFAHVIAYTDYDKNMDGNFILSFEKEEAALNLSSAISERLGIGKFEEICEDSIDLLNEFLNIVVGRTISEWDKIGLKVKFGIPVLKRKHKSEDSKNLQAYTIIMNVIDTSESTDDGKDVEQIILKVDLSIVLRVDLSNKIENKIKDKKILIVEDSRVMRKIIAKILKKEGATVEEAGDGEEAIMVHKTFNPDLTLMDINMPKMNGLESIIHIKEFHPKAKFIILSSSSRKDEIITAKTLNVSGYLIKPVEADQLIKRVSNIL